MSQEQKQEQKNPLQINPDRMIQLLSEKVSKVEVENAALRTQVEQLVNYINEMNKPAQEDTKSE